MLCPHDAAAGKAVDVYCRCLLQMFTADVYCRCNFFFLLEMEDSARITMRKVHNAH
jgi:hypothetical protein